MNAIQIHIVLPLFLLAAGEATLTAQAPGTFTPTGSMTASRYFHSATLLADGRVLIAGGYTVQITSTGESNIPVLSATLYDPRTGTFSATADMPTAAGGSAILLPNGKVLIGGNLYDPATGSFIATGDPFSIVPIFGGLGTVLLNSGKVLIAGGGHDFRSAEIYDPSTGSYTPTGDMNASYADTATLLPNGKVLITHDDADRVQLFYAELYDPDTGQFIATGNTLRNHTVPTATLLPNGKVLLAGGDLGDGDGASNVAELYDPGTGTFSLTGRLIAGREQHTATLLADGTVLFIGGHNTLNLAATAEIYDPATGTFHLTGGLSGPRELHTATLLNDGRVLITGGDNEQYWTPTTILSSALLYIPAGWPGLAPSIGVDKTSLSFAMVAGQQGSEIIAVTNLGGGGLQWRVGTAVPWLSATPTAGIDSGSVNVAANAANLQAGTYNSSITITAPASNTPRVIPVSLIVLPSCQYALSASGEAFSTAGGSGSVSVTAFDGCNWTVSSGLSWVTLGGVTNGSGNGKITFQVMPNSETARSGTISVAGFSFVVEQQSALISGLGLAGAAAQVAFAGDWNTSFTLINTGTTSAKVRLDFFDDDGSPLVLPLAFPQSQTGPLLAATLDRTIAPNATLVINTVGSRTNPVQAGSLQLLSDGSVSAFSSYRWDLYNEEAAAPVEARNASAYLFSFDHTNGSLNGEAIANLSSQGFAIPIVVRDDAGAILRSTSIPVAANGHLSFLLSVLFPETANKRGTVEFDTPSGGRISVAEFKFSVSGAFSTIPDLTK